MKQCWIIYPWRSHRGCNEFAIKETTPAIRWWRLVSTMRKLQCLCNWAESVSFQSCCNWLLRVLKFFMEFASAACNFEAKSRSAKYSALFWLWPVPRNWWCWTTDFNIDLKHASSGKSNFACLIAHVFPTLRIIELSYRGGWLCIRGFWDLQTPNHQVWNPMILGVVSFRLRPADLYQKSRKWAGDIAKMGNNNTRRFPWQVTNLQCMI